MMENMVYLIKNACRRNFSQSVNSSRRVVVTGVGLITPLGVGLNHVWNKLIKSESGLTNVPAEGFESVPCKVAAYVPRGDQQGQFSIEKNILKSEQRTLSLASCFALSAADEALNNANWFPKSDYDCDSTGVAVGTAMAELDYIIDSGAAFKAKGYNKISPFFVPRILNNMAAGNISIRYKLKGPNHSVATACATGVHAIGDAFRFIQNRDADVMVCGGSEGGVNPFSIAAFSRMRALSTAFNDQPTKASRPFDRRRDGFVMGEGAGILVLESLQHAQERNAKIYAEILGYGLSGDGYHITSTSQDGQGPYKCMCAAIKSSGLSPTDISYVNAHATSTPTGDLAEARAILRLFGEHSSNLLVSSTKGAIGHLLGAAGCVETIFTIMACYTGVVPPTLNLENPDDEVNLNLVPEKAESFPVSPKLNRRIALKNSFGFGGTNASLVIGEYRDR